MKLGINVNIDLTFNKYNLIYKLIQEKRIGLHKCDMLTIRKR
jgi:hypothetical protein